ncbi:beta-mannosidase [Kineococcus sp. T13]|uniref:beta-mannosidase n=1 Tax=Kineococcus vitellinus TaxID=2696565 RepID=UPI001412F375|nr:beta-mannosidase [Kineococcus vitellinus]NAZ74753.1 beta-mannosidase [Kineococcus vitellinus]
MRRPHSVLSVNGTPATWLGVNFWSRSGGPRMWTHYDRDLVRDELRVLHEHGLRQTRSFSYWPDFVPEPGVLAEEPIAHYLDFLQAHLEVGMTTIPTFLVGHMSGENWDPSWRGDRDLYTDVWLVAQQSWFITEMTRRTHAHPAVAGWLISNEMPIYGRRHDQAPARTEDVTAWAQLVVSAVRAGGGSQPVSIGDGAWGIEVTGRDNGFSVRELGRLSDFTGPHVYAMENDPLRQHLNAAFVCELAAVTALPVVLEEFGLTDEFASAHSQATYYRQTLHTSLLAGATGWIAWNNTDYDGLAHQAPYSHHPFEMHFGVTDANGAPKPALRELADFSRVLADVDITRTRRVDTDAALVVTSFLERHHPFTRPADSALAFRALRQAYVAAREADLPLAFTREADGLDQSAALYVLPSVRQLLAPTWTLLRERAEAGATVYASVCAGDEPVQRGPWVPHLGKLFGVEHQLVYGLAEPVEDDVVQIRVVRDFGSLRAGEVLLAPAAGTADSRTYLPVVPAGADVVATDAHGRPLLLEHRVGAGRMVLCTYPLENMAACSPRVNPEPTWRIYDALASVAGARRQVTVADPLVWCDVLEREDGTRFAWFLSQHPDEVVVDVEVGGRLLDRGTGADLQGKVRLAPYGVLVSVLTD